MDEDERIKAALVIVLAAALVVPTAAARTPLPAKPQGAGGEPIAGGGLIAGSPFLPGFALVFEDAYGDLNLVLLKRKTGCRPVAFGDAPYVWVYVHTDGTPPVVGKPSLHGGQNRVQVNVPRRRGYVSLRSGVRLRFTRVDASQGGIWHGTLEVSRHEVGGRAYSYSGTFAARWCGRL